MPFTTTTLICRATRPVRLYRTPYDTSPASVILGEGAEFKSRKQYMSESTSMAVISESTDEKTKLPTGYWCPVTMLQSYPIFDDPTVSEVKPERAVDLSEELEIVGEGTRVYPTYSSSSEVPNGLRVGDTITIDMEITIPIVGVMETRGHIATVNGEDQTVIGQWITLDRTVSSSKIDEPTVLKNPTIRKTAVRATTVTTVTATTGTTSGQGLTAGSTVTAPDGSSTTIPNLEVNVENDAAEVVSVDLSNVATVEALYDAYGFNYTATADTSLTSIPIGRMLFVHGMPFQYTHITDRRGNSENRWGSSGRESIESKVTNGQVDLYGRSFAKEIASNMPILVLAPGVPKFLTTVKKGLFGYATDLLTDARNTFLPIFSAQSDTEFGSILENLNDNDGDYQYYSMEIDTAQYFKYVNSLCQTSARLMGIGKTKYRGKQCEDIDWGKYNSAAEQDFSIFEQVMGLSGGVSFAFDPQSSVSDTMTNQTTESQLMGKFNDVSSMSREMDFVLGYTGSGIDVFDATSYQEQTTAQLNNSGIIGGISNVVDRIGTWFKNASHGMNIRFPEIWSESSHTRSYDIEMHFITPYATAFCKWRYVLVPFFHLFALAAPRSDTNSSQYKSPFLIRAFSKGYFNVEMGIIESITWKRFGEGDSISQDGIPTQIDVSISFKDLYHSLTMTNMFGDGAVPNVGNFMTNTGLMDLVGTLSGVNMNRISLSERLALFTASSFNAFGSLGSNFMRSISDRVRNIGARWGLYR